MCRQTTLLIWSCRYEINHISLTSVVAHYLHIVHLYTLTLHIPAHTYTSTLHTSTHFTYLHTSHTYTLHTSTYCTHPHTAHIYTLHTSTHCTHLHTAHIHTLHTSTHCTHQGTSFELAIMDNSSLMLVMKNSTSLFSLSFPLMNFLTIQFTPSTFALRINTKITNGTFFQRLSDVKAWFGGINSKYASRSVIS